ncbi:MAG: ParB/RepB/Spo0J family partition protein [Chloroflexi bacterium]|nr:ParB/RepB/Spo0J family partition protein [Chloroflexota bacterium]
MSKRKGGLGSGLDALLPGNPFDGINNDTPVVREVPIGDVRPNRYQPRKTFDELAIADLASSIKEHGIIQPLLVTRIPSGGYELIAGERRLRAAMSAGLAVVPVVVRESTPQEMLEIAIIENIQRADLNPIEEALAYQALKDEFQLSDEQIAKRMGRTSRVQITNTRRLLRLIEPAQAALRAGQMSAGHGRALLKFEDAQSQALLLNLIINEGMTVREAEQISDIPHSSYASAQAYLREIRTGVRPSQSKSAPTWSESAPGTARTPRHDAQPATYETAIEDQAIARQLEQHIGTPIQIHRTPKDVRLTFVFHSQEKLQEFLDLLSQ